MPRPTTKQALLDAANGMFEKLWKLINAMPHEVQVAEFAFEDRDKNLRDVLVHLYEWHQLLLRWVRSNMAGQTASFLPAPYNWKTYMQMNIELWKKNQHIPLEEAKTMFRGSHAEVVKIIEGFTDEELFAKKHFPWTGTTSLGSYCISATSSHYDWALRVLARRCVPAQGDY
jgi:hypothetical protein